MEACGVGAAAAAMVTNGVSQLDAVAQFAKLTNRVILRFGFGQVEDYERGVSFPLSVLSIAVVAGVVVSSGSEADAAS